MKRWTIILLVVLGVLGLAAIGTIKWGVGKYNALVAEGQNVDKSWGQVENVLQRRNDLIPNLVNVVQAYAAHEQEVFIKVAEARASWAKAMQAGKIGDKIKADSAVSGALFNLMAMVERYPDVKANQNFLALQDELAGTENRIAVERMRYNESVQAYNTYAKVFPNTIIVSFGSFPPERDYFKAAEGAGKAPEVRMAFPAPTATNTQPAAPAPAATAPIAPAATSAAPTAPAPVAAAPVTPTTPVTTAPAATTTAPNTPSATTPTTTVTTTPLATVPATAAPSVPAATAPATTTTAPPTASAQTAPPSAPTTPAVAPAAPSTATPAAPATATLPASPSPTTPTTGQ